MLYNLEFAVMYFRFPAMFSDTWHLWSMLHMWDVTSGQCYSPPPKADLSIKWRSSFLLVELICQSFEGLVVLRDTYYVYDWTYFQSHASLIPARFQLLPESWNENLWESEKFAVFTSLLGYFLLKNNKYTDAGVDMTWNTSQSVFTLIFSRVSRDICWKYF